MSNKTAGGSLLLIFLENKPEANSKQASERELAIMATATSAWAKPGAWALESEEYAAAMEKDNHSSAFPSLTPVVSDPSDDFPSLAAAAAASKSSKKKKKKTQVLSMAEFVGGKPVSHGAAARSRPADSFSSSASKGLTPDELQLLPTGPREHSAEELERSSRGFGYSSYGNGGARRDGPASRVSGDEPRRSSLNKDSGPSRADEVDDWASVKRSAGPPERRERGGGFFDSQSKADEVDSWISKKSSAPPSDGLREKRGGFEMFSKERPAVGGADSDTWARRKEEVIRADSDTWGRKKEEVNRADSDTWGRKKDEVNGTVGGRPRLVLQGRSVPLANGHTDCHDELNQGEKHAPIIKSKGSNPFGLARPREEVLAEKGQDWKKLDEKLESMKIREGVPDRMSFGKKGLGLGNGNLSDERTERSWRKEEASDALASKKEDQTEESELDN